jgi:hypothetical protein
MACHYGSTLEHEGTRREYAILANVVREEEFW